MTEDHRTLELPEVRDPAIELAELRARVEALEAAQPHRLREPLHLTPEQEEEIAALLRERLVTDDEVAELTTWILKQNIEAEQLDD